MYNNKSQKRETQYTQIKQHIIKIDLSVGVYSPNPNPPPRWNFQLGLAPPGKTISVKKAVTLYCYAKDDCSCHQEKKNLLFMLIQCLIISILPC